MTMDLFPDFTGWPAERTIFPVSAVSLRVQPGEHPFYLSDAEAISRNWASETAANPALFDGRILLHRRLRFDGGTVIGEAHVAPFSAFMWWRRQPDRRGAVHLFCYPVLVSSDGALVAIRMSRHTANPGQVYFAAGSLEPDDIVDGYCDAEGNMRREVREETGLDLRQAKAGESYYASHFNRAVTILRLFHFDETADEMIAGIERHMRESEEKEIDGAVAIRSADHSAHPYNTAMLPIIDWYFDTGRKAS